MFASGVVLTALAAALNLAAESGVSIEKADPRMAVPSAAVKESGGIQWIDGRKLPIEGRAFDDVSHWYDRLPSNVTSRVNSGVRSMKRHTAGMQFRFRTGSKKLIFRWRPTAASLSLAHMPATGVSGIDVYRFDEAKKRWMFVATGKINNARKGARLEVPWTPGEACLVNLPLYNGLNALMLGFPQDSQIAPGRLPEIEKPIVFYGSSITQGGCASKAGSCYSTILCRHLDAPEINFGFSL